MRKEFKFNLRDDVVDDVTSFKGVIIARCDYVSGSNRYEVQPIIDNHHYHQKILKSEWIDEDRLSTVKD